MTANRNIAGKYFLAEITRKKWILIVKGEERRKGRRVGGRKERVEDKMSERDDTPSESEVFKRRKVVHLFCQLVIAQTSLSGNRLNLNTTQIKKGQKINLEKGK